MNPRSIDNCIGSLEVGKRADFVTLGLGPNPVCPESAPYYVVVAASRVNITRTIVDGEVVYDRESSVRGISKSDQAAVGDASAALWDRL